MSEKTSSDRELIRKMSKLLLKGAKMLDETCPVCGTPLFFIKDVGLKYCPKCDVFVATPEELKRAKIDEKMIKIMHLEDLEKREKEKTLLDTTVSRHQIGIERALKTDRRGLRDVDGIFLNALYLLIDKFIESVQQEKLSSKEILELIDKLIALWKSIRS